MKLGLIELFRKPARFGVAGASLVLLTVLLLFLGGLLDGLYRSSTGLLRSQPAELVVFSSDARESLIRSRIDPETRAQVEAVPGVRSAGGLGVALVGGRVPGQDELANLAVVGFEKEPNSMPMLDGVLGPDQAFADRTLEAAGVELGQVIEVGAARTPVTVIGWVSDTDFLQQGGFWVQPDTWRRILGESRPDANLPPGTFQVLAVTTEPGADLALVAAAVDAATGTTTTLTRQDAVLALPGIREQNSTFSSIIYVTLFVAGLVVALFFALLTLERIGLYAVFKAIGASTRQIFTGVITQAVVVALVSFVVGAILILLITQVLPTGIPIAFEPARLVQTAIGLVVMSALGAAISLRRVVKVDPASAIG